MHGTSKTISLEKEYHCGSDRPNSVLISVSISYVIDSDVYGSINGQPCHPKSARGRTTNIMVGDKSMLINTRHLKKVYRETYRYCNVEHNGVFKFLVPKYKYFETSRSVGMPEDFVMSEKEDEEFYGSKINYDDSLI